MAHLLYIPYLNVYKYKEIFLIVQVKFRVLKCLRLLILIKDQLFLLDN